MSVDTYQLRLRSVVVVVIIPSHIISCPRPVGCHNGSSRNIKFNIHRTRNWQFI